MPNNVVVVESPAKAKTIEKYLGGDYKVLASYGHVRDLRPKEGAVDPDADFSMHYEAIERNHRHVDAIAKALKKADNLYLATDPDREGEAISWHLYELLQERGALEGKHVGRVVFHEITKGAIQEAIAEPRTLSDDLVHAQQARRALDYLVGFNLSPLLWKKIRRGLSAGRVQSPALRLIVEREEAIEAFQPREYWSVEADLTAQEQGIAARLTHFAGEKLEQFSITDEARATEVRETLEKAASGQLTVHQVEKKQRRRNPSAPFTTSTLQQEASRKLGFSASKTMTVAQQLYEGVDIGGETVGLITYMRTDSVNLADEAVGELRSTIEQRYGKDKVPGKPRSFKTKSKNAQEAHEAIRPTGAERAPDTLQGLTKDQQRLYDLIWKRAVASQMTHATINTVAVDLIPDGEPGHTFRATGSTIEDPGFMAVYREGQDDGEDKDAERILPPLAEGETVTLDAVRPEQHFTEPPPRYTEATLVRTLEEHGIGRPSTYASIIATLQQREYVEMDRKRFIPTDVGRVVNRFLTNHFPQYVDYDFTARLEDELDEIARGERDWVPVMREFWEPFHQQVEEKEQSVSRSEVTQEDIGEACPECGKPLVKRLGRRGAFIGCTGYPECRYTRNVDEDPNAPREPEKVEGRSCPECGGDLIIRQGRYGKFIGCNNYPECRHVEPLEKPEPTGVTCPECGEGELNKRKSRAGKTFYSCSRYPDCKYAVFDPPIQEPCPRCEWPILTVKTTKKRGREKACPRKECRYSEPYPEEEGEEETGE
ncbi:DNA topoisomerase-1 [Thiohalospira halophila DSM 15071]|uniref:DNA topoisomerase 1 n=1 Tax=Thiohalospira halophila DSM 15071 TaxID=1123397 RepID=A0A1I1RR70_9GAMM|nr:type I DNA topoisomerase [Thiohalospira halophila]SFD34063.1 DNA topoisomerase-1 [Thiohalospira halophila DSM 15071]